MADLAAPRDASSFDRPDVRKPKRYHVVLGAMPACGMRGAPVAEFAALPLASVPVDTRCRRAGCRERWPAAPDSQGQEKR